MFRTIAALSVALFALSGCVGASSLFRVADNSTHRSFNGVLQYAERGDVRVIFAHGMCNHKPQWAIDTQSQLEALLGIRRMSGPADDLVASPGRLLPSQARLAYRGVIDDLPGSPTVETRYLMWSPIFEDAKREIGESRVSDARVNTVLQGFVDECLADAVIYLDGSEGGPAARVRQWLRQEVCDAFGGVLTRLDGCAIPQNAPAPTVVLASHSLGSKMLFDALQSLWDSTCDPELLRRLEDRIDNVSTFFMFANQLALLNHGYAGSGSGNCSLLENRFRASRPEPALIALARQAGGPERARSGVGEGRQLHIVQFTDHNDALSYLIEPARHVPEDVSVTNLVVANTQAIAGLIAHPEWAHTKYLCNRLVMAAVASGFDGESINAGSRAGSSC